jgi:hypothetical protein
MIANPTPGAPLSTLTTELMSRFSRTSHTIENVLKKQIIASADGIDRAVRRIWTGYVPGKPWKALESPDDRWSSTQTAQSADRPSKNVHFNTLNGSLLMTAGPLLDCRAVSAR